MQHKKTKKLATLGMLAAISIVLVSLIHFPIFPAVPFLEFDPADIPIFIGTFAFGPIWGLILTAVVSVIQGVTVSSASGIYGIIMHFAATGAFVIVAGCIYRGHKTRRAALVSLGFGTLSMTLAMIALNLLITPYFMNVPRSVVVNLMPFIVLFNVVKAGINSLITLFVYKSIHRLILSFTDKS